MLIYVEGKIIWVMIGGEGGYGYYLVEYSDGKVDVELFYNVGVSVGVVVFGWSKGFVSFDVFIIGLVKYMKGEIVYYDSVVVVCVDWDSLNKYV